MVPFIIIGGALQTCGAAMNGQLYKHLINPWLASTVSFALITIFFLAMFLILPHPLPTSENLASMPWWAVVGGLVGAVQVYAGLTLVTKVGAGSFVGITVTAALIMSLLVDHFGWFRIEAHPITVWRILGAVLMIGGVTLISRF
ncbi:MULTISPECIES: DMT family transporter [unclassified Mycobacterium]|uniref:DMT family transporter n=1 Tax=unclassified Mycobacterium TaxID=2642494 RepID=UPI000A6F294D|nr:MULTISPECIES: DMT family transporter [unclassified Mycobacterium]